MKGYEPWENSVIISALKAQTISAHLKKLRTGIVKIYSIPSNAVVYINGIERGSTPLTIDDIPVGEYRIEIMKDKYQNWTSTIMVTAEKTSTISKQLKLQDY